MNLDRDGLAILLDDDDHLCHGIFSEDRQLLVAPKDAVAGPNTFVLRSRSNWNLKDCFTGMYNLLLGLAI